MTTVNSAALDLFHYQGQQVRTVLVDAEPWFVAADVCAVLDIRNSRDALGRLDDDEKGVATTDTLGGPQSVSVVNEHGLYALTFTSRKPEAKAFKRWVTHEVLPTIRRTGQFGSRVPATFAEALELAAATQRQIEAAETALAIAAPKVAAYDRLMDADGYYSMEAAAKALGIGRNTMFARLREEGILLASNLPAQRYAHHFKVTVSSWTDRTGNEHPTRTTRVLPTGLAWLARRLGVLAST